MGIIARHVISTKVIYTIIKVKCGETHTIIVNHNVCGLIHLQIRTLYYCDELP